MKKELTLKELFDRYQFIVKENQIDGAFIICNGRIVVCEDDFTIEVSIKDFEKELNTLINECYGGVEKFELIYHIHNKRLLRESLFERWLEKHSHTIMVIDGDNILIEKENKHLLIYNTKPKDVNLHYWLYDNYKDEIDKLF